MAAKKSVTLYIALALLVMGVIELLNTFGIVNIGKAWWLPIILILVGLLVIISAKGMTHILGWICLVYGAILILMTMGLFQVAFLWKIAPASLILFGLILML